MKDYKKEYEEMKHNVDILVRHAWKCPKKCKYCREWYEDTLRITKKIEDRYLKSHLLGLWKMLWDNNCRSFDVIAHHLYNFEPNKQTLKKMKEKWKNLKTPKTNTNKK